MSAMPYLYAARSAQVRLRRPAGAREGWFWGMLCLAVFGYLFLNIDNGARFPVREVRLDGGLRYLGMEHLQRQVMPLLGAGFFGADLERVRARLVADPWVRAAAVRRLWPDRLHITITEERPLVRWDGSGFINHSGELVELPEAFTEPSLPLLKGPPGTHAELLGRYLEFNALLAPTGLQVRALSADQRGALKVLLDNGWLVMLGRADIEQRFERFTSYAHAVLAPDTEAVWAVDMRYANGYAVRWRDGVGPYVEATVQR